MNRRRIFAVALVALLVASLLLASCQPRTIVKEVPVKVVQTVVQEVTTNPVVIEWVAEGTNCPSLDAPGPLCAKAWAKLYMDSHPGVIVNVSTISPADGTNQTMNALILSGLSPDLFFAYGGRLDAFLDYAAPLPYDPALYTHPAIDAWVSDDGQSLFMYPMMAWATGMTANYTLAEELGIVDLLPALDGDRSWSVAEFEAFCEAAKAKGYPAFGVFALNGSGDYWTDSWALGRGATLYKDNDLSQLNVNSAEWVGTYEWFTDMVSKGYMLPDGWTMADETVSAEYFARRIVVGHGSPSILVDTGDVLHAISYPSLDGSFVPFATAPTGLLVFDSAARLRKLQSEGKTVTAEQLAEAERKRDAAVAFAVWLNTGQFPVDQVTSSYTWRADIDATPTCANCTPEQAEFAKAERAWMDAMIAEHGLADIGVASKYYQFVRNTKVAALAEVLQGNVSAQEALDGVVAEFNAALAEE